MKTALIAVLFVAAATAATAQLAAPDGAPAPDPAPSVQAPAPADASPGHAQLKADRARVKADKERLKMARGARDDDAIRSAQATLQTDMAAWHSDRESLKR